MSDTSPVVETRVALTVEDYESALRFYRDALGLPVIEAWGTERGSGAILGAGRATIEILSTAQSRYVEEIEAGGGDPDPVRLALEVHDSTSTAETLAAAGAKRLADPIVTPWSHRNVRLRAPDGLQLTLFTVLGADA